MDDGFIALAQNIDAISLKNALNDLHPNIKFSFIFLYTEDSFNKLKKYNKSNRPTYRNWLPNDNMNLV